MRIITFSSFKGGCGKSTATILIADAFAASGRRVLVVDLDHQRNTSAYFASSIEDTVSRNVAGIFAKQTVQDCVVSTLTDGVDLLAGTFDILNYRADNPRILRNALEAVTDNYDVVVVDTAPTLDGAVKNGWYAADILVAPVEIDSFNFDGALFMEARLREELPEKLNQWRLLFNNNPLQRSDNPNLPRNAIESAFFEQFPARIMDGRLQRSQLFYDHIHSGKPISRAKASVYAFDAVCNVAGELLGEPFAIEKGGRI